MAEKREADESQTHEGLAKKRALSSPLPEMSYIKYMEWKKKTKVLDIIDDLKYLSREQLLETFQKTTTVQEYLDDYKKKKIYSPLSEEKFIRAYCISQLKLDSGKYDEAIRTMTGHYNRFPSSRYYSSLDKSNIPKKLYPEIEKCMCSFDQRMSVGDDFRKSHNRGTIFASVVRAYELENERFRRKTFEEWLEETKPPDTEQILDQVYIRTRNELKNKRYWSEDLRQSDIDEAVRKHLYEIQHEKGEFKYFMENMDQPTYEESRLKLLYDFGTGIYEWYNGYERIKSAEIPLSKDGSKKYSKKKYSRKKKKPKKKKSRKKKHSKKKYIRI